MGEVRYRYRYRHHRLLHRRPPHRSYDLPVNWERRIVSTYDDLSKKWQEHEDSVFRWATDLAKAAYALRQEVVDRLRAPDELIQLSADTVTRPVEVLHIREERPVAVHGLPLPESAYTKRAMFFGLRVMLDAGRWKASLTYVPLCVRLTDGQPQFALYDDDRDGNAPPREGWVSGLEAGVALVVTAIESYIADSDPYRNDLSDRRPIGFIRTDELPTEKDKSAQGAERS
jgi:hypothetical protein